jgi:rhomboid protease GluP
MFRREIRTIVCPSCGRLTREDAAQCLVCGRRRPGLWGLTLLFRRLFGAGSVTQVISVVCIALYVASLVFDPLGALRPRGIFDLFAPSQRVLDALGMTGAVAWAQGRWWTLLTAIYLHGSLLHIVFNVLWIRQLGPAVEELYGPARFLIIFTVSGVAGFVLSDLIGFLSPLFVVPFTIGASGAIFGLLGAMVAFGRRRGGLFGTLVLRQYGQWALILFIFGLFMSEVVNNWAHAGGFIGGFGAGLVLSLAERRSEGSLDHLLAAALAVLTVAAFGLAVWRALI